MNSIQRGIISLIKSGITGEKLPLPEDFNIQEAYKEIIRHGIAPLAYTGAVNCGIPKDDPTMKQLFALYIKLMLKSEQQMAEVDRIFKAFDENNIDYLPLKGINMKKLYPKPELRQMGDADILIREEQYAKIKTVMKNLGFEFELDCSHTFVWKNSNLLLELHKKVIPPEEDNLYQHYTSGWEYSSLMNNSQYSFSDNAEEYIFLFLHYAKHYRAGGIGLRHLTDLWLHMKTCNEVDESKIINTLQSLNLKEFYNNTLNLLTYWFEDDMFDAKSEFMSEYIFSSGNWGTAKSAAIAFTLKKHKDYSDETFSNSRNIIRTIFPSLKLMCARYPTLNKHPVLLPAFWIARIVTAVCFRQKNIKRLWKANQYSTPERIETFQEALDYVGLGFDF